MGLNLRVGGVTLGAPQWKSVKKYYRFGAAHLEVSVQQMFRDLILDSPQARNPPSCLLALAQQNEWTLLQMIYPGPSHV